MAEGISSEEFKRQLEQFKEDQKRARHEGNSRVFGAIIEQGKETTMAFQRLIDLEHLAKDTQIELRQLKVNQDKLADSLHPFSELAQNLKSRLLGDPGMRKTGLVDDFEASKITLDARLTAIERQAKENGDIAVKTRKEQMIAICTFAGTFVTTIGLIIVAWIQLKKAGG